jgi:hypothetical protein
LNKDQKLNCTSIQKPHPPSGMTGTDSKRGRKISIHRVPKDLMDRTPVDLNTSLPLNLPLSEDITVCEMQNKSSLSKKIYRPPTITKPMIAKTPNKIQNVTSMEKSREISIDKPHHHRVSSIAQATTTKKKPSIVINNSSLIADSSNRAHSKVDSRRATLRDMQYLIYGNLNSKLSSKRKNKQ